MTVDPSLRRSLHEEQSSLFSASQEVLGQETFSAPERRVPYWVRAVVAACRNFF